MDDESYKTNLILIILDKACAVLSMIGSSFMGRDIVRRWNEKRATTYGHLPPTAYLLGNICVADIGYSFWAHFLGSWMVPKEEGYSMAAGNATTCAVQGNLGMFFLVSGFSLNTLLAITYWLTVCREKPESELRTRRWKGFLYVFSWTIAMAWILASTAVVKPTDFVGMSWPYCMAAFGAPGTTEIKIWGILGTMYGVSLFIVICLCMGSLVQFVYKTEKQSNRFSMAGDTNNRRKTIATAKQALFYIGAFLTVLIPTITYCICVPIAGVAIVLPNWVWSRYSLFTKI